MPISPQRQNICRLNSRMSQGVERTILGSRHQPRGGVVGNSAKFPHFNRAAEGFLHNVLPLTTLPVSSSGCPGSLTWPFSPRSLNHSSHFSKCLCLCSGDSEASPLPRNRNVNSLMCSLLWLSNLTFAEV